SSSIVWSQPQESYDKYTQLTVEATGTDAFVTVFVEGASKKAVKNTSVFVDDASVTVIGQGLPTTAVAQVPTNTPETTTATATETAQPPVPTETTIPTVTPSPTREGTIESPVPNTDTPTAAPETPGTPETQGPLIPASQTP